MGKSAKKQAGANSAGSPGKRSKKVARKGPTVARSGTKQSTTIELLRSAGGATIDALTKATGWQQHSVRGFLAGVVRKRLKLDLDSSLLDGVRVYRITGQPRADGAATHRASHKS
jgi:uncharacterized protein DUF3489